MGRTSSTLRLGLALVAQGRGRLKNTRVREPMGLQETKWTTKRSVTPPPLIEHPAVKSGWRRGRFREVEEGLSAQDKKTGELAQCVVNH